MTRILIAEDDQGLAEPLSRALVSQGYQVSLATDGGAVVTTAVADEVDLVILDVGLPGLDGFEVCRQLRVASPALPVLMLTARNDEMDIVVGLDAGADDYVTKPFRLAELMARVRALLRRGDRVPESEAAEGGPVRIDEASRRAWNGSEELTLSSKEFSLLRVLLRETGQVVSRDQLMREVWDAHWWGSTKTLDMHISWLRRKLGDSATHPKYIFTVRGVGFRFEQPVE